MFICTNCKEVFPLWKPSCPDCSRRGTLEKKQNVSIVRQDETTAKEPMRLPTSFPIFNSVFAGGFLRGFLYFLHATRGSGKTTFLLKVCSFLVSQ
jgi:predicted ATP-dependent serine protease